jgi:hypothetical protein
LFHMDFPRMNLYSTPSESSKDKLNLIKDYYNSDIYINI